MVREEYSCGILTMSDKGSRGEREDTSGKNLREIMRAAGFKIDAYQIIPDNEKIISATLKDWADSRGLDLIITTGGTGVSPSDVTPEATAEVIDRELPGIAEAMRQASFRITPHAVLSRARCGIRGNCLIINLPGSKKAAQENIAVVLSALPHAIYKIKGGTADCGHA
ncbi:MAG TPA: MogA/MoaB family molybdenum cofactor biosynthesis protein [Desulfobacterales bacterium]|nr:MogA/MoaB family molybdenum cofactor biosynthesis protein [Desulfobacterales bacterium]